MTTTRLQFTVTLEDDLFRVEAEVIAGPLNRNVFYFANAEGGVLGAFKGVVDVDQLTHYPVWTGPGMPTFGVPFVRHNKGFDVFANESDIEQWKTLIAADVKNLALAVDNFQPIVTTVDMMFGGSGLPS